MRRSYLETLFRHRLLILAPVVLAFVLGATYGLRQPRTYQASAGVWADTAIPNDSTIGTTGGSTPPSAGQAALLGELLASRAFLLAVAQRSPLAGYVSSHPPYDVDGALSRLAGSITATPAGPQVLTVTVEQKDPELAVGLAVATVQQLLQQENDALKQRAGVQVAYDTTQLDTAATARESTQAALQEYLTARTSGGGTDTRGTALLSAASLAQQQYADAEKALAKDNAAVAHLGDGSVLRVLDTPLRAYAQSRRKALAFGGVGGLLAGGTVSVLLLLLLTTRDQSVRDEEDVLQALGLQVVSSIAELPRQPRRAAAPLAALGSGSSAPAEADRP